MDGLPQTLSGVAARLSIPRRHSASQAHSRASRAPWFAVRASGARSLSLMGAPNQSATSAVCEVLKVGRLRSAPPDDRSSGGVSNRPRHVSPAGLANTARPIPPIASPSGSLPPVARVSDKPLGQSPRGFARSARSVCGKLNSHCYGLTERDAEFGGTKRQRTPHLAGAVASGYQHTRPHSPSPARYNPREHQRESLVARLSVMIGKCFRDEPMPVGR